MSVGNWAELGHDCAQFNLAECYELGKGEGNGVEQDLQQTVHWYTLAAEQGDVEAQHNLGYCYLEGEGVEKDEKAAIYWLAKATEQGDAQAQYGLRASGICIVKPSNRVMLVLKMIWATAMRMEWLSI